MNFKTSPAGRALIEKYEGLRLHSYQDMVGVWTIGYGHTGPDIGPGLVWTKEQCDQALSDRLASEFEPACNRDCSGVPTTQGQFDALVSLHYNVGTKGGKDVIALHREGQYDAAADAFLEYDHAGGMEIGALAKRRAEEGQMYLNASPGYADVADQQQSAPAQSSPLWLGSSGPAVMQLQKKLARSGYPNVKADGEFGPITKAALLAYEAQHHLPQGPILLEHIA